MNNLNSEEKVFKGYWWTPKSPEIKIAGILTYNGKEIILELIGSLAHNSKELLCNQEENLIYGIDSDSKKITLINCHKTFSHNLSSTFPIEKYDCLRVVYGKHIGGMDEKRNYSAYMFFPELPYWAHPKALYLDTSDSKNYTLTFSSEKNKLLSVELSESCKLIFCGGVSFDGKDRYLSPELSQTTFIKLESDELISISDIERYMRRLSNFLSIAFLSDVCCTRLYLTTPEDAKVYEDGQTYYSQIEIYRPKTNEDYLSKKTKCIFDLNDIETNASTIIKKWMTCSKNIYPIMLHLVDSLKKKPSFSSVDFLIVIQAIEGFWWRFRDTDYKKKKKDQDKTNNIAKGKQNDKTTLNTALNELLTEHKSIIDIEALALDIEAVVDSRNYYSHFLPDGKKKNVKHGFDLFELSRKLRILLLCIVLKEIDFTDEQVKKVCCNLNNS